MKLVKFSNTNISLLDSISIKIKEIISSYRFRYFVINSIVILCLVGLFYSVCLI